MGQKDWGKIILDIKDLEMDTDDQMPLIDAIPDQLHRNDIDDEDERNFRVDMLVLTRAMRSNWNQQMQTLNTGEKKLIRDYETTTCIEQDIDSLKVRQLFYIVEQSENIVTIGPTDEKNNDHCTISETDGSTILEMLKTNMRTQKDSGIIRQVKK